MLQVAGGLARIGWPIKLLILGGSRTFFQDVPPELTPEFGTATRIRDGIPWVACRLRSLKPGLTISVMGYLNLALLAAKPLLPPGTKLIAREANVLSATSKALPQWLPANFLYRKLYRRAAAIVAPAQSVVDELLALFPDRADLIHLVPNPVSVRPLRERATKLRRLSGPGPRFVAAGRLTPQKGFDRLVRVFQHAPAGSKLTIFGDGPERTRLLSMIEAEGLADAIFLGGFTDELPAWIAGADAFLLPSRWEGLPNVVLESLALGTPVITSHEAAVAGVALSAPAGAVKICDPETEFADAIARVGRLPPAAELRPSLLPATYLAENVVARWAELLTQIERGSRPA